MPDPDLLHRFLFEKSGIRGNLIHLDASWQAVLQAHHYPDEIRDPLGQSLAAVMLLSTTIKFDGSLILLYRLFNQEQVRLFEPEPVAFRCGCSRTRIESTLVALGHAEISSVLEVNGKVEVTCEFCNRQYRFDPIDIGQLFAATSRHETPTARH